MASVHDRIRRKYPNFQVAMLAIDLYPELLVRFNRGNHFKTEYRLFFETEFNQKGLKYPETSEESLSDWAMRKVGVANKKIGKVQEIEDSLRRTPFFVIFAADR